MPPEQHIRATKGIICYFVNTSSAWCF